MAYFEIVKNPQEIRSKKSGKENLSKENFKISIVENKGAKHLRGKRTP